MDVTTELARRPWRLIAAVLLSVLGFVIGMAAGRLPPQTSRPAGPVYSSEQRVEAPNATHGVWSPLAPPLTTDAGGIGVPRSPENPAGVGPPLTNGPGPLVKGPPFSAALDAGRQGQVVMVVRAYCPCRVCCGAKAAGITASGRSVTANGGLFLAAPPTWRFGTMMSVPGYAGDRPVPVLDRGPAQTGGRMAGPGRLEVFFPDHQTALNWGVQRLTVTVYGGGQ